MAIGCGITILEAIIRIIIWKLYSLNIQETKIVSFADDGNILFAERMKMPPDM